MSGPEPIDVTIDRAIRIEAAGGRWTLQECAAVLRMRRETVYRHPQLRQLFTRGIGRKITVDPKAVRALERRVS